jgi:4-amino-4-deoxy-L-arabinose transferase-like glycosyltransferase
MAVLVLGSVFLRLAWIASLPNEQVSDSVQYCRLASSLARGDGYALNGQPNTFWPVGYPFFLSLVYRCFPAGDLAGKLANVALSAAVVALTYLIGRRLFGESAGRVAAVIVALLPSQVVECSLLRTETLFLALFLLGFWLLLRAAARPRFSFLGSAGIGIALGLASLVRPLLLPFPVVALLVLWLSGSSLRKTALTMLTLVAAQVAVIAPWTVRNAHLLGEFVPVSTNGGYNLWIGNNPFATGTYWLNVDGKKVHSFSMRQELLAGKGWNDAQADRFFQNEAVAYIRKRPDRFVINGARKLWYLYLLDTDAVNWALDGNLGSVRDSPMARLGIKLSAQSYYVLMMALALLGMVTGGWTADDVQRRGRWIALLVIAYFTAIHMVTVADDRYHAPVMPFLAYFSALYLTRWAHADRPLTRHPTRPDDAGGSSGSSRRSRSEQ